VGAPVNRQAGPGLRAGGKRVMSTGTAISGRAISLIAAGTRPFTTRRYDRATNLWPLALLSFGESWHNMHHSDPVPPENSNG
jgi:hypothetical protein